MHTRILLALIAGIVMLALVLGSAGVPLQGIGIIMGVDRVVDMCRTVVNITGDAVCAVVVAATEGRLGSVPEHGQGDEKPKATLPAIKASDKL